MNINDNSDESFFSHIDESLSDFFDIELDDKELEAAYPIQNEIKKLSEHYEILGEIDQGGMKKIFRAKDLKAERIVALAQLKREAKQETIEQFLREARLTASLQHPNIITIYDIGIDENNSPFFTMELLEGQTLKSFIENKASQEFNIDVFLKICDAIAFAHSHSILHLDLKPENVYVGSFGQVTVCDWGIARILKQDEEAEVSPQFDPDILNHMTLQGQIKGTPGFMAPEQAMSNQQKDQRTDIYALGGILYFMFSKKAPIQGKEITTLIEKTKRAEIQPLDNYLSLPRALKAILTKCLSPEPQDRYASIIDLKLDIIKYQKGFATLAEDAGLLVHLQLLIRRQYKALVIIMFILALIVLMGTQSLQRIRQERNLALKAEQVAQAERIKAEENLTNLKEAHLQNKLLTEDILELTNEIADSDDLSSAKRKIALLNEALKKESKAKKRKIILRKKALLHFVLQEFTAAAKTFSQMDSQNNLSRLIKISDWAKELKHDSQSLSDSQFAELLLHLGHNQYELIKAMYFKHTKYRSHRIKDSEGSISLAKIMVFYNNKIWEKNKLNGYSEFFVDGRISLANLPISRFIVEPYKINILSEINFDYLDISNTSFFEFVQIKDIPLKTLNISACRLNEINPMRIQILQSTGLKTIIYQDAYLKPEEIQLLSKYFILKKVD
ncbi:serine/threonine-protein kinase [Lentisphaera profundi]|uniref:Serine/threonine-protein kinase n=1 Tax=Lentisphaera profundi TaxID=1658616 RepID=A0ABY7VMU7_9BACT|nr:serine/threonine-protein kinase [Lentisphaera profundi]WDE95361.1 serine/threonine-protein kinase [Lentisphaera profundi]